MVKLNGGNFLKAENIKPGETIKIINEGEWIQSQKYTYPDGNPKQDFVVKVEHQGEEKSMRLNKTNRDAMIKVFGDETSAWVGKTVAVTTVQAMVQGKLTKVILLNPANDKAWDE